MIKNKLVFSTVVSILTILVIGLIGLIVFFQLDNKKSSGQSIDEIVEATWQTEEMTTNLNGSNFIRIQFQIQLDNKKTKKEVEKRDFQIYNLILNELANMKAEDFEEKDSLGQLEERLKEEMNTFLDDGEVKRIYTIKKIIQ